MHNIVKQQKDEEVIKVGLAFRYAYNNAKEQKFKIWVLTLSLSILQMVFSILALLNKEFYFNTTYAVGIPLIILFAIGIINKPLILRNKIEGCSFQQLHDYLTMNLGNEPSIIALPPSMLDQYSAKQEKKVPKDRVILSTWWPEKLNEIPSPVDKLIAIYSSISYECKIREEYNKILKNTLKLFCIVIILISFILNLTVLDALVYLIAPSVPVLSIMLNEMLLSKLSLEKAMNIKKDCYSAWRNLLLNKLNNNELISFTRNQLCQWQNFRESAPLIFDFIYSWFRKRMDRGMVVDADTLINQFKYQRYRSFSIIGTG